MKIKIKVRIVATIMKFFLILILLLYWAEWSSAFVAAVAKAETLGFTAAAGPDRAVFFNFHRMGRFA